MHLGGGGGQLLRHLGREQRREVGEGSLRDVDAHVERRVGREGLVREVPAGLRLEELLPAAAHEGHVRVERAGAARARDGERARAARVPVERRRDLEIRVGRLRAAGHVDLAGHGARDRERLATELAQGVERDAGERERGVDGLGAEALLPLRGIARDEVDAAFGVHRPAHRGEGRVVDVHDEPPVERAVDAELQRAHDGDRAHERRGRARDANIMQDAERLPDRPAGREVGGEGLRLGGEAQVAAQLLTRRVELQGIDGDDAGLIAPLRVEALDRHLLHDALVEVHGERGVGLAARVSLRGAGHLQAAYGHLGHRVERDDALEVEALRGEREAERSVRGVERALRLERPSRRRDREAERELLGWALQVGVDRHVAREDLLAREHVRLVGDDRELRDVAELSPGELALGRPADLELRHRHRDGGELQRFGGQRELTRLQAELHGGQREREGERGLAFAADEEVRLRGPERHGAVAPYEPDLGLRREPLDGDLRARLLVAYRLCVERELDVEGLLVGLHVGVPREAHARDLELRAVGLRERHAHSRDVDLLDDEVLDGLLLDEHAREVRRAVCVASEVDAHALDAERLEGRRASERLPQREIDED